MRGKGISPAGWRPDRLDGASMVERPARSQLRIDVTARDRSCPLSQLHVIAVSRDRSF